MINALRAWIAPLTSSDGRYHETDRRHGKRMVEPIDWVSLWHRHDDAGIHTVARVREVAPAVLNGDAPN